MSALTIAKLLQCKREIEKLGPAQVPRLMPCRHMMVIRTRDRSWSERLLSWPWRPWQRRLSWKEPSEEVFFLEDGGMYGGPGSPVLVAHPVIIDRIMRALDDANATA